jgi:hypothetical protein
MTETGLNNHQLTVLNKFRKRIKKERFLNNQASVYYSKQNSKFVIPGILITGISSIASFMATSDILGDDSKKGFSVGVGIMTAGATILQSIASSFGFQSRTEQFQKSADAYDSLLTKIEFEIANPNEDFNEFCNDIESTILGIKNDCNYLPPLFIHKLWEQHQKSEIAKGSDTDSITHLVGNINPNMAINTKESDKVSVINIDDVNNTTTETSNVTTELSNNKSEPNEVTSLFQDTDELSSEKEKQDYRSINFVSGMTQPHNLPINNEDAHNIV